MNKIPVYVLKADVRLSIDQIHHLRTHWARDTTHTVLEGSRLLVLSDGLDIQPLSDDATEIPRAVDVLRQHGFTKMADWLEKQVKE